ncbi:hypothetical protein [Burkholderia pyrrocinia]|uniref:Uncharacterized protein n=1 Tax=Burkholderia pyrrocinia TaxID=60550 RepID=A0ABZ3BTT0_BURPY
MTSEGTRANATQSKRGCDRGHATVEAAMPVAMVDLYEFFCASLPDHERETFVAKWLKTPVGANFDVVLHDYVMWLLQDREWGVVRYMPYDKGVVELWERLIGLHCQEHIHEPQVWEELCVELWRQAQGASEMLQCFVDVFELVARPIRLINFIDLMRHVLILSAMPLCLRWWSAAESDFLMAVLHEEADRWIECQCHAWPFHDGMPAMDHSEVRNIFQSMLDVLEIKHPDMARRVVRLRHTIERIHDDLLVAHARYLLSLVTTG